MQILGLAGTKRAGKDSSAKYILGHYMKKIGLIEEFIVDAEGDLFCNYEKKKEDKTIEKGMAIFDPDSRDENLMSYMDHYVHPEIKIYHFAEPIKGIAQDFFGIEPIQLWGCTEDKESPTKVKWSQMLKVLPEELRPKVDPEKAMTGREFMQRLADVMRSIDDDCFTNFGLKRVKFEQCPFAIIGDVRRASEVRKIRELGGKVILHTRHKHEDSHKIENELREMDHKEFDAVIDNQHCSMTDKNIMLFSILNEWGWV